jgi:exopolysaccharide production protein ExoZ
MLKFAVGMVLGRLLLMRKRARTDGGFALPLALGDASYSIYLTHIFTLGALRVVWLKLVHVNGVAPSIAFMVTALVVCAFAGWLCFLAVERPLTRRFKEKA